MTEALLALPIMRYFIPIPDRYAEHDSHKAVSIQIVGTVVCGPV